LKNLTDRSDGKEIFGLGIFERRVPKTDTSDKTVFQQYLIQYGQGFIRLEKKGGNDVREDDRLFQGDEEKSLRDGNAL
jgi:hypothetical protein